MKYTVVLAAFALVVHAHPLFSEAELEKRTYPNPLDENESNSGLVPVLTFDPIDQFVDVRRGSGHEFVAPHVGDLRGPCPGLNAAANHGFIPHNGVVSTADVATGLAAAFGMGPEFATILSVIAIALSGDPITQTWSIGGVMPSSVGLLTPSAGLSYSHNKYEADASPGRGDAYLHNGDAHSLNMDNFDLMYNMGHRYTMDMLREHNKRAHNFSIMNNPYFFAAPFGSFVPPAAFHFIPNFMSNRSKEHPNGILERHVLKTFFAVSGPDNKHVWNKGMERIPDNWYRRPSTNMYNFSPENVGDLSLALVMNPEIFTFGGNLGKKNTFTGVNLADLTGGVYNLKNLANPNYMGCFMLQSVQAVLPDYLNGVVADVEPTLAMVANTFNPIKERLHCPALKQYNQALFDKFPGYHYNPKNPNGHSTPYKKE